MKNYIAFFFSALLLWSCKGDHDLVEFTLSDESTLGQLILNHVERDPSYPIVSREEDPTIYATLDNMLNQILASDRLTNSLHYEWEIILLDDDQLLQSFCAPGGQLFIYTGLFFFLNKEDELAGVISHEVAHAEQRHVSQQLLRRYGISTLKHIASGGLKDVLPEVVNLLANDTDLIFSRGNEKEADSLSIRYLEHTRFACNGAADAFAKLIKFEMQRNPPFLKSHSGVDHREEMINNLASQIGCTKP